MPDEKLLTVNGDIIFAQPLEFLPSSTIYVRLEDVTFIDSPSKIISEQMIRGISHQGDSPNKLEFEISGEISEKRRYTISVHADINGDGKISKGDFINKQSYPVLTYGYPNFVSVIVKKIE